MSNPFAYDPTPAAATAPTAPVMLPPNPSPTVAPAVDPFGGADPFANSDPAPQIPRGPRFRELYDRLLLLIPTKLERGIVSGRFKNPDGSPQTQDRMTAHLIVLDGGTINYGGEPEKIPPVPHMKTAATPARWDDTYISFTGIISQCRDALAARAAGKPGMVLGRLSKGADASKGNPAWLLIPATEADKATGRAYLASVDPFAPTS